MSGWVRRPGTTTRAPTPIVVRCRVSMGPARAKRAHARGERGRCAHPTKGWHRACPRARWRGRSPHCSQAHASPRSGCPPRPRARPADRESKREPRGMPGSAEAAAEIRVERRSFHHRQRAGVGAEDTICVRRLVIRRRDVRNAQIDRRRLYFCLPAPLQMAVYPAHTRGLRSRIFKVVATFAKVHVGTCGCMWLGLRRACAVSLSDG